MRGRGFDQCGFDNMWMHSECWGAGGNLEAAAEPQRSDWCHCDRWKGAWSKNVLIDWCAHLNLGQILMPIHFWTQGTVTKSSLDNTTTSKMAGLVKGITNQARSVVRDLDPVNELAFLRLRSTKTEFLIAPGNADKNGFMCQWFVSFQTRIMF